MKRDNSILSKAKQNKNDEFYTLYESIEKEIKQFNLKGKKVFCNCDSSDSNFYKYFKDKYNEIGLSGLVAIGYSITGKSSAKISYDGENETKENIIDGSFESDESILELKKCDVVITNPPFSKYRKWFDVVYIQNKKDFINIGTINMVTYKKVFQYIKDEKLIVYDYSSMYFKKPDGTDFKLNNACWFSTIKKEWPDKIKQLRLTKKYYDNPEEYPKYDNYDAINVDKTSDIPIDYYGVMGVPITYLDKHNPDQFEIVAFRKGEDGNDLVFTREREREFNHIFESWFAGLLDKPIATWTDEQSERYKSEWEEQICESGNQANIEPIDYFYPLSMRGCAEPYLDLAIIKKLGRGEIESRQLNYNGKIVQKTYHRLFIRRKSEEDNTNQ